MTQATAILGLHAQASIHAGAGQATGVVDLPIQREGHNDWPCVYGSGVKGALRARGEAALPAEDQKDIFFTVFGPETTGSSEHAGALLVGDARLLLLPVRSLTGHFRWVTCRSALQRYLDDRRRLGFADDVELPADPKENVALVAGEAKALFLEEYRFQPESTDLDGLIGLLNPLFSADRTEELRSQLTLVSNDMFGHFARSATPVAAHVRIDNSTKTVKGGALWYEETLPPETVLYSAIAAQPSRREGFEFSADEVLGIVRENLFGDSPWLQLGGNETTGMGWCHVKVLNTEA